MRQILLSISLVAIVGGVGCGGGGGGGVSPSTVSGGGGGSVNVRAVYTTNAGSAAIGAAMSNASISIQPLPANPSTEVLLTADDAGLFTVPSTVSLPALVKATSANGKYTHYGYIKSSDQVGVPVNPITTVLLTLASGGNPSAITSAISDAALADAKTKTLTLFQHLLTATNQSSAIDFLSKTFTTDHTGLDLILDSVGIQLSATGNLVVLNKLTGVMTNIEPSNITPIGFDTTAVSRMNTAPIQLCANFLNGLTSQTLTTDTSIYDANFLASGRSRDDSMAEFREIASSDGFKFSMPIFEGFDSNGNLSFDVQLSTTAKEYISDYRLTVKKHVTFNKCVLVGNLYPFEIRIQPAIKTMIRMDGLTSNEVTKFAGLEIYVGAHGGWTFSANSIGSTPIKSARVDVCNSADVCTSLATLTNLNGAANGIFDIDGQSANNKLKILQNSNVNLFTDILNSIKITLFTSVSAPLKGSTNSIGVVYTRSTAPVFSAAEVAALNMPTVSNASILTGTLSNPTLLWNSDSAVISELSVLSSTISGIFEAKWKLILKKGTGSTTFAFSDRGSPYRSISISAHIPNRPGMLETKYIWAPTCSGCY
jgi:hypothetical protein